VVESTLLEELGGPAPACGVTAKDEGVSVCGDAAAERGWVTDVELNNEGPMTWGELEASRG
jgi:hypothetical protein